MIQHVAGTRSERMKMMQAANSIQPKYRRSSRSSRRTMRPNWASQAWPRSTAQRILPRPGARVCPRRGARMRKPASLARCWVGALPYAPSPCALGKLSTSGEATGSAGCGGCTTIDCRTAPACWPSLAAAAVTTAPNGMPRSSVANCMAVPHLARSTGLGPVQTPLFELCAWSRL